MPIPRFHVDAELDSGREIVLPAAVSRHATRTLRLEEGDPIIVFDGRSDFEYDAVIVASRSKDGGVKALLGTARAVASESPLRIELAQGLCKGERMDFVVQKATELGVCAIHPLLCERSVSRPDPGRAKRRIEHWQGVAIHAAQQSGRVRIPVIAELQAYEDWMAKGGSSGFFLHPEANESPGEVDMTGFEGCDLEPEKSLRVIVGPEGGFSQREVERAQEAGYRGLRLGPRILRTETAGLVAIALLQARLGDLG